MVPDNVIYTYRFKMFVKKFPASHLESYQHEKKIIENLEEDQNIVTYYTTENNELGMEKVYTSYSHPLFKAYRDKSGKQTPTLLTKFRRQMKGVQKRLQDMGIYYVDWKLDNIGYTFTNDGDIVFKVFDFDSSGLSNNGMDWTLEPPKLFAYHTASNAGHATPEDIDNYLFGEFLKDVMVKETFRRVITKSRRRSKTKSGRKTKSTRTSSSHESSV